MNGKVFASHGVEVEIYLDGQKVPVSYVSVTEVTQPPVEEDKVRRYDKENPVKDTDASERSSGLSKPSGQAKKSS